MQCVMRCMIVHEWNVRAFFWILFSLFFFPYFNECEMQMSYADAMIGLTNVICKHCALICYWQTPNYWPRCRFSMNANKIWCKSRFFYLRCKCFFFFFLQGCECEMSIWCTCLISEVQFSWCRCPMWWCKCNAYPWWCQRTYLPVMQMSPYRDGDAKCLLMGMSWGKCFL